MARGKEFTDRLFTSPARARAPIGTHESDQLRAELGIEHRFTPPKSPQSETDQETVRGSVSPANGMVERFNLRIADVLRTNRFDSALDLEQTLMRYVVRRSLGPMAFTAHTHTTPNCRNPP